MFFGGIPFGFAGSGFDDEPRGGGGTRSKGEVRRHVHRRSRPLC